VRLTWVSLAGILIIFFLTIGYYTKIDSIALYGTGFATVLLAAVTYNMA
jgi:hypothetical protein